MVRSIYYNILGNTHICFIDILLIFACYVWSFAFKTVNTGKKHVMLFKGKCLYVIWMAVVKGTVKSPPYTASSWLRPTASLISLQQLCLLCIFSVLTQIEIMMRASQNALSFHSAALGWTKGVVWEIKREPWGCCIRVHISAHLVNYGFEVGVIVGLLIAESLYNFQTQTTCFCHWKEGLDN